MRRALILGAIALAVLSISFPADASTHAVRATTIARMLRFVDWTAAASPVEPARVRGSRPSAFERPIPFSVKR
jgi:hypothetical protein